MLLILLFKSKLRSGLANILRAIVHPKIFAIFVALFAYVAAVSSFLWLIGYWDVTLLKATILWTIGGGVAGIFESASRRETNNLFKAAVKSQLGVIIFVEYVATFQTFSLPVELLILPVSTFFVMLLSVSQRNAEHELTTRVLNSLLAVFGFLLLAAGLMSIWAAPEQFWNIATLKDLLLPIILSLLILPFHFTLISLSTFETRFAGVTYQIKDEALQKKAKRCAMWHYAFDLDGLNRWFHELIISNIQNVSDLDRTFTKVKNRRNIEANPPEVPITEGWSPFVAMKFPKDAALHPRHYKQTWSDGGDWRANSDYVKLGKGLFPNQLFYSVEGSDNAVTRLSLHANIEQSDSETIALSKLREELSAIGEKSGLNLEKEQLDALSTGNNCAFQSNFALLKAERRDFSNQDSYDFTVDIMHKQHKQSY